MDNDFIEYSVDAINSLSSFYDKELVIYVEGEYDILFYDALLTSMGYNNYKILNRDGSEELDSYIEKIVSENANIIAFRDSDYLDFNGGKFSHDRVIYTHGHSMENSLLVDDMIVKLIKNSAKRIKTKGKSSFLLWFNDFYEKIKKIISLDILSFRTNKGLSILGDNCTRFMNNENCAVVNNEKINNYYKKFDYKFKKEDLDKLGDIDLKPYIRGHFLFSMIYKYVINDAQELNSKARLTYETMYCSAILILTDLLKGNNYPFYDYYSSRIEKAFQSIV
ncbi:DUF4435 domain-containing protein [Lonsdalea quercina]|uniref:DUF4435 domain-containing protein n=1 Tax=Lonsdalea quercina TaxID=71657 RepID=UPI003975291E